MLARHVLIWIWYLKSGMKLVKSGRWCLRKDGLDLLLLKVKLSQLYGQTENCVCPEHLDYSIGKGNQSDPEGKSVDLPWPWLLSEAQCMRTWSGWGRRYRSVLLVCSFSDWLHYRLENIMFRIIMETFHFFLFVYP